MRKCDHNTEGVGGGGLDSSSSGQIQVAGSCERGNRHLGYT